MKQSHAILIGPLMTSQETLLELTRQDLVETVVIAVDAGLDRAREAGILPDIVVGDFDGISDAGRTWVADHRSTLEISEVNPDKDFSDLDLALRMCRQKNVDHVILVGFLGGRIDHQLSVLGVCARFTHQMGITLFSDKETIALTDGETIIVEAGRLFSVIALVGDALVSIEGARYPLENHWLAPLSDLGLSNYAKRNTLVSVQEGLCAVIIPR